MNKIYNIKTDAYKGYTSQSVKFYILYLVSKRHYCRFFTLYCVFIVFQKYSKNVAKHDKY